MGPDSRSFDGVALSRRTRSSDRECRFKLVPSAGFGIQVKHPSIGALSECWSVSASYKGLEGGRDGVREIATRLKKILDEDGVRYKGQAVYVP